VWVVRQRALVAWFAERLRAVLGAAEGSPLRVVLKVYVTCDDALTTAVEGSAGSSSSSSPSSSAGAAATPPFPPPPLLPELATLPYSRPSLHTLVHDALDRALAPCGTCYPVCRCGELAGAGGECANDEEECVGGCGGVASARELLERQAGDEEEKGGEEKEEGDELVPTLGRSGGCCGSKGAGARAPGVDEIVELPSAVPSSCCAPPRPSSAPALLGAWASPSCGGCCARTTGGGCCTGVTEGLSRPPRSTPMSGTASRGARAGWALSSAGRAISSCVSLPLLLLSCLYPCAREEPRDRPRRAALTFPPRRAQAELRNAVAAIRPTKQVRVGGITVHVEQYSV